MPQGPFFRIRVWTTRFLGTVTRGQSLLRLLRTMDGSQWVPERWNKAEPIRKPFSQEWDDEIIRCWIEDRPAGSGEVYNDLLFRRKRPRVLILAHAQRLGRPRLN